MKTIGRNFSFFSATGTGNPLNLSYKPHLLLWIFLFSALPGISQRFGLSDNFESGRLSFPSRGNQPPFVIWDTDTPASYQLIADEGVLKITWNRLEGMGAFDHFTYHTFRASDVSSNPRIQVDVKSDIATTLTVSPVYSKEPPTVEYLEKEIPGDNQWHTYTFNLTKAYYTKHNVEAIDFYLDRGLAHSKSGTLEMDNFRTAWYLIHVTGLKAKVEQGNTVHLQWNTSDEERTAGYRIYRSNNPGFPTDESTFLAETEKKEYTDTNLAPYKHYFYKVLATGTDGEKYFAAEQVQGETYIPGKTPEIKAEKINTPTVKKYEKFEIHLALHNVGIENPYDPEDIDVYAVFTAPSRKTIRINGFYDNHENADQWKLRFSPNETGEYSYRLYVNDTGGKGQSEEASFTAMESEHHGWIKPSTINPHYFIYDDGTSYYGTGVYSPWQNNMERFDTFSEHHANFFALWDITYGGFVNGTGLIEEKLGRYNQVKCNRIDSLLAIFEKHGIKLMYAIWPHDLFSETVWAAEWRNNPYSQLIDVEDVYSDSLVWEYQKKKYRYMIARFAHSRSWGIWELINEMNGTDGWAHGRHQECYDWVEKCDAYFEENDPYNHPTTASFSGGFSEYREPLYERNDIANIHMYPAQGWPVKYPNDTMRSAIYNYAWASKRFWDAFEKPAIFGEAGASLAYYSIRDEKYHTAYHNQIWASLTNGLAATPVWWDYPVLTAEDWKQLKNLSLFVADIDFANLPYQPMKASAQETDVYVMGTGKKAFGWARSCEKEDISGTKLSIQGMEDHSCRVEWFDPWNGKILKSSTAKVQNGQVVIEVPKMPEPHPDIALKIETKQPD